MFTSRRVDTYEQRAAMEAEKQRQLRMRYLASQPPGEAGVIRSPTLGERVQTALPTGWYSFAREASGVGPSTRLTERLQNVPEDLVSVEGADWAAGVAAETLQTGLAAADLGGLVGMARMYAAHYGEDALRIVLDELPLSMKQSLANEVGAIGKAKKAGEPFYVNIFPSSQAGGKNIEIIKNPSIDDLRAISKEFRKKYPRSGDQPYSRSTYDAAGNEYLWRSDKATHADVERALERKLGIETSQHQP